MATLIKASGEVSEVKGTWKNMKSLLDNATLEFIPAVTGLMVVDEEGKLKELPINNIATRKMRAEGALYPGDFIVGDCVFITEQEYAAID